MKEARVSDGVDTSRAAESYLQDSQKFGSDAANLIFEFNYLWRRRAGERSVFARATEAVNKSVSQELMFISRQTETAVFAACVYLSSAASLIVANPPIVPRVFGL